MTEDSLRICYTCLQDVTSLIDLQEEDIDSMTYIAKLSKIITFELISQEAMGICTTCVDQLRVSYKFLETVTLSQTSWRRCLEEIAQKTEEIEDKNNIEIEISRVEDGSFRIEATNTESTPLCNNFLNGDNVYHNLEVTSEEANSDNNIKCSKCLKLFSIEEYSCHNCLESNDDNNKSNKTNITSSKDKTRNRKPKKEVSYQCTICETFFNKRWKLRKHLTKVHDQEKRYSCSQCEKSFKQSYHLKEHLTCHTGEKKFSCDFCGKKFQRSSSMKRHMRSHDAPVGQKTKRTPFLCNICGKNFPFSNGVQRHMRVHLGIKMHECEVCHRRFRQSTHLHVHMRTHTGEKPYICNACGEAFTLKARLQKHISSYHESEDNAFLLVCGFCGMNFIRNDDLQSHIGSVHCEGDNNKNFNDAADAIKHFSAEELRNYHIFV